MDRLPTWPLAAGALAAATGVLLVARVTLRLGRALAGRSRQPPGRLTGLFGLLFGATLLASGAALLALVAALRTWQVFTAQRVVADIRCQETAPRRLTLTYTPVSAAGVPGMAESYALHGDEWMVGGDVLRFKPQLTWLGLETVFRVNRVEGRFTSVAEARAEPPTVFEREGGSTAAWLEVYRDGVRGPLGWLVAGAHGQGVWQLCDPSARYELKLTHDGFVLDTIRGAK